MKARDHLRAATREAARKAREGAGSARQGLSSAKARAGASGDPRVKKISEIADSAGRQTAGAGQKVKTLPGAVTSNRKTALERAGGTGAGAAVGKAARRFGVEVSRLPVLSLPTDAMRQRNGVVILTDLVRESPEDPIVTLWLAEALTAMERDMRRYTVARAAISPTSLVTREVLSSASTLGIPGGLPAAEMMTRQAYALATKKLEAGPDADALHVVARVYMLKARPEVAVKPAKLALVQQQPQTRAHSLFTLARAYLKLRHDPSAERAATMAVDEGCTLGHLVLADLLYRRPGGGGTRTRHKRFVELCNRVSDEDRDRYFGPQPSTRTLIDAIWSDQFTKTKETGARVKLGWLKARRAAEREAQKVLGRRAGDGQE